MVVLFKDFFKIWFDFEFLLSEAAFTSFVVQVHMLVQPQGKGQIRELVQLKVIIVEGDTVHFWFFIQPALLLSDLPDRWLDWHGPGDRNVWQKHKAT